MRASEIPYRFLFLSASSLLLAVAGCSGSQSDRTVRVSQSPAQPGGPAEAVPARLAGGSAGSRADAGTSSVTSHGATASIDDSGGVIRQANRIEPVGMIGGAGGVDEEQLMEAFRHADPQVREMAERQARAVTRAQSMQFQTDQSSANRAAGDLPLSEHGMISSTDAENDRGVPTLPGSQQRVSDAQPNVGPPSESVADVAVADSTNAQKDKADLPSQRAGDVEPSDTAPGKNARLASMALDSRGAEVAASYAEADDNTDPAQDPSDDEQAAAKPDAAEDQEAATFEERLAMLDEKRLFEALIARYGDGEEEESEAAALRRRINHRLLLTMAGRVDEAVEPLEGLASSEQEYLRHQILALWTAIDPQGHPVSQRRWATALPHLREATSYLAAATGKLDVRSLTFCTEVVSFGRVKPFEVNRFAAGQEVILYSEIDCFAAERLSDGYETHFNGSFEILDASGKRIADKVLPSDRQSGKNYRRDYFIAYRMHLPSHLDPGSYRMELTIEDL
ncbi:MAG: hypothetical protein WD119_00080, partial [Pirellulaceae bacterium]